MTSKGLCELIYPKGISPEYRQECSMQVEEERVTEKTKGNCNDVGSFHRSNNSDFSTAEDMVVVPDMFLPQE